MISSPCTCTFTQTQTITYTITQTQTQHTQQHISTQTIQNIYQQDTHHYYNQNQNQNHNQNQNIKLSIPILNNHINIHSNYTFIGKCYIKPSSNNIISMFITYNLKLINRKIYDIILINQKLSIYRNGKIYRFINFNVVSVKIIKKQFSFVIVIKELLTEIYIQPVQNYGKSLQHWIQSLNTCINHYKIVKHKIPKLLTLHKPQQILKIEHIVYGQFKKQTKTGDLILFKSSNILSKIQRKLTFSEYDHIGMIVRDSYTGEIYLFESLGGFGVICYPWKHFMKYKLFQSFQKICWRPLNKELNQLDLQIVDRFIDKTKNKGYSINITKFIHRSSIMMRSEKEEKKKQYFCSELIARIYKELGLLDECKSSARYLPVHFTEKKQLKIIKKDILY